MTRSTDFPFRSVAIVGVGLIGGSLGAALRNRGLARVIGVGRDPAKLAEAKRRGLLDACAADVRAAAGEADLLVFCTPVDRIVAGVREAAAQARPGTLITDAGSVKGALCRPLETGLPDRVEFLGSHPMAGSEKQGFEHADANLFERRLCILTPVAESTPVDIDRLTRFWQALGMRTCEMTPEEHDVAVAEASHLPHLLASALAVTLRQEHRPVAASGFRDSTRVAAGDPGLWTAILLANSEAVLASLDRCLERAGEFREALLRRDAATISRLLAEGKAARDALNSPPFTV